MNSIASLAELTKWIFSVYEFNGSLLMNSMVYEVRSRPPNLLKNAQLQISRVLKATCRRMRKELWCSPGYYYQRYYELMLEAVDADGVKFYQAQVAVDSVDDRMWLEVFCVMDDEHYSLRLYHHLGERFTAVTMGKEKSNTAQKLHTESFLVNTRATKDSSNRNKLAYRKSKSTLLMPHKPKTSISEGGSGMTTERPVPKRSQYRAKAEVR
ncbi:hypothetical protein EV1_019506 [Malus domestica]